MSGELIEAIASVISPLLAARIPGVEDGESCVSADVAALECAAAVVESLGLIAEYAVCFEDDEQVWLIGDRRYLKPEFARNELPSHIQLVQPFVGRAYVGRWEKP